MEIPIPVRDLNTRLKEIYGRFEDGRANYRITFAGDEREIRLVSGTNNYGEQWKYNYNRDQFVLERLLAIPGNIELITKTSYEPVWFFHNKNNEPLPPKWEVCELVINSIHKAAANAVGAKYKDPDAGLLPDELLEKEKMKIDGLIEELFGNETEVGDCLAVHEGVTVPVNYDKSE